VVNLIVKDEKVEMTE